jgi:queuine tRNA-ribosyltransferase
VSFPFSLQARCGAARRGQLRLVHGVVETPAFMPVGTLGAVKGLGPWELENAGAQVMLANLYHLAVRPGIDAVKALGGIHAFTGWRRPILTDSGGFQVMSLAGLRRLDEEGVTFRNHLDGATLRFTPASVVQHQEEIGVDIAMVLDECPPWPASSEVVTEAVRRSTAWARRAREAWSRQETLLFGVVQGGVDRASRERAAADLVALDFPGYAVGGVSVGEPEADRRRVVEWTAPLLPEDRPRYLMGVGTPRDILHAVAAGFDLFDCVLPARNARHGLLFTSQGPLRIKNAAFRADPRPIDPACACPTCASVSRGFLHHLVRAGEITAATLATVHNLRFYLDFMGRLREAITSGSLAEFAAEVESATTTGVASDAGEDRANPRT